MWEFIAAFIFTFILVIAIFLFIWSRDAKKIRKEFMEGFLDE